MKIGILLPLFFLSIYSSSPNLALSQDVREGEVSLKNDGALTQSESSVPSAAAAPSDADNTTSESGNGTPLLNAEFPSRHLAVFENFCFDCHDSESEKGGVNLEDLSFDTAANMETAEMWASVLDAVNSGEMPPPKKKQLPKKVKLNFLRDLSHIMVTARKILSDSGGEITMRRLNRREYINSIRALTGLEPNQEDYLLLPKDEDLEGFDTNGSSLNFSSHQFNLYRKIAKNVLTSLVSLHGSKMPEIETVRTEVEDAGWAEASGLLEKLKKEKNAAEMHRRGEETEHHFLDDKAVRGAILDYNRYSPHVINYLEQEENKSGQTLLTEKFKHGVAKSAKFRANKGGRYIVRYRLATKGDPDEYEKYVHLSGAGLRKIRGTLESPEIISTEVELQPLHEKVSFTVSVRDNLAPSQRWYRFFEALRENGVGPVSHIWVDWIEYEGPYYDHWPPYELESIIGKRIAKEDHYEYVRRVIHQFAKRAFRDKDPSPEYVDKLLDIYRQYGGGKNRHKFKRAIVEPLSIILASPNFLFLAEPRSGDERQKLTDRELAVRLSYFLWSAPPDEELLSLARSGALTGEGESTQVSTLVEGDAPDGAPSGEDGSTLVEGDAPDGAPSGEDGSILVEGDAPDGAPSGEDGSILVEGDAPDGAIPDKGELWRQTERLLNDPRSFDFVKGFTYQWLGMVEVDTFQFSPEDFPLFDEEVRTAAKEEVYHSVRALLARDDIPLNYLVNGNSVFVNELLADYYNIPDVVGPEYRVVVTPDSPRGGLLGMAAFHILGSDGKEVNLVKRGAWVLNHLLDDPAPPPPANVPQLSRLLEEGTLPARKLLSIHMEEPQCAQCHRTIDPVGYGLQNFDAAGNWRDTVILHSLYGEEVVFPVDPSGALPNGAGFNDYYEFRQKVGELSPYLIRGFIKSLVAYGLGRDYSIADLDLVHDLYKQSQSEGGSMRSYIHGLVQSEVFKSK